MKTIVYEIRSAVMATVLLVFVCCGIYPLVVHGIAQIAFPHKANGSLIMDANGTIHGSTRIGQTFVGEQYFHPRPSAAGAGYDGSSSSGSNLGPTSEKLRNTIRDRIAAYRAANQLNGSEPVPADAVTASASGLDPHISLKNAELQAPRVARARGVAAETVLALIPLCTEGPDLGIFGVPGVNVVRLNLLLDQDPKLAPRQIGTAAAVPIQQ